MNNYLLESRKNYAHFLKVKFQIKSMKTKLMGLGTLSLFLIMLIPAYAEVTELSIEKSFYTIDEGIVFVGTADERNSMINIVVENPNTKESYFIGAISNSDGVFETAPKNVSDFFSIIGTYQFTAFTIQKDDGISLSLEFDGNRVLEEAFSILELNSIEDKITEVDKTVSFSVSITDSTFANPVYSLENEPTGATINSSGQFVWTPTASHGNIEDVSYNFDIIVNADNQEDKESVTIIVKKAYEQPVVEPVVEPVVDSAIASFVDQSKDPQSYVDRYNNEESYKKWFDDNYSQYSSIYQAVGLEEPEFGICGEGTKLIDGICTIIEKTIQKPWWQFW